MLLASLVQVLSRSLNNALFLTFLVKPGKKLSECQRRYQHAISRYTPHAKIPQCKPDGSFEPLQCDMSYCYCVDQNGDERPDTRLNVRYGRPDCDEAGINTSFRLRFASSILFLE